MSDTDDKSLILGCLGSIVLFIVLCIVTGNVIVAFLIGFALGLVSLWYSKKRKSEQNDIADSDLLSFLSSIEGFKASQRFISEDKKYVIAVDENTKKVCFIDSNYGIGKKLYSYKGLIKSEIIEDGESVTTTSRSSQLGGAILGGMIAGGAGAVVGALSGSQSTKSQVKSITLQITTNDTRSPVQNIKFLYLEEAILKNSVRYQHAFREANHWHGLISVLIKRADAEEQELKQQEFVKNEDNIKPVIEEKPLTINQPISIADELGKLAELLRQGLLTQEEFNSQKKKLLGDSDSTY